MEEYISKFIRGSPTIDFYLIKSSNNEEDYTWSNNIWDGYKKVQKRIINEYTTNSKRRNNNRLFM